MPLFKKKASDNLEEFRDIKDEVVESDFVPYACHWNAETIVTRNGETLQVIKITDNGGSEEAEDLDLRKEISKAIIASIDSTEYAVWIHTVRRKMNFQTGGEYKRDFAGYLDRFWKDRNDWQHKFVNEIYITIVREGEGASLKDPVGFFRQILPRFDIRHREKVIDESCEKLAVVVDKVIENLSQFGARKLGFFKEKDTWYSGPCSFLGKLVTLQDDELPVAQVAISDYLTDYDVTFGYNAMEVRMRKDGRRRFGAYLTIKECREIPPGPLDELLKLPTEFVISQCFVFTDSKHALKDFEYQQKLFKISNASALAQSSGLDQILTSNTGKNVDYCEYQLGIFLLAESVKSLESSVSRAVSTLGNLGLAPMREDVMLEECYWSILPANFQCMKRLKRLNTSAMGGFANLNFLPRGKARNNHWGPAITTLYTITQTPYFFNFHEGDNGHTLILGPSDAGKTVITNFLLAQSRKFDGKLVYFDRERRSEIFIRSIDGVYFNPYPGADARPYVALTLNPLQLDDTQANRDFLERWLLVMAGSAVDAKLAESARKVIALTMPKPKTERQFTSFAKLLIDDFAGWTDLLAPWMVGGKHEAVFNNAEDTLMLDVKVCGFDMEGLIKQPEALSPVFAYLLHRVMQSLDGKPSIVVLDEAWDLLATPVLAPRVKEWLHALKEKNALALLTSENIDHIKESPLNALLMEQVPTKIFLPDDAADASYAEAFGLSARDITLLTVMNADDRHFMVTKPSETVVLEMSLSGMADIIAVLESTPYNLQMMEQAISARGISPSQWMPKFLELI